MSGLVVEEVMMMNGAVAAHYAWKAAPENFANQVIDSLMQPFPSEVCKCFKIWLRSFVYLFK